MLENIGVSGKWIARIDRADGSVENFGETNTIETAFKQKIVDAMVGADTGWAMGGSLHTNDGSGQGSNTTSLTTPATGKGGIVLNTGGTYYVGSQTTIGSSTAITNGYKLTFTGIVRASESYTISAIYIKHSKSTGTNNNYDLDIASGANWSSTSIADGDQLTISWIIQAVKGSTSIS
jgi:hypothetical protein